MRDSLFAPHPALRATFPPRGRHMCKFTLKSGLHMFKITTMKGRHMIKAFPLRGKVPEGRMRGLLLAFVLCLTLCGCGAPSATEAHRKVGFYFDTVITLTAYDRDFTSENSSFFTRNKDASDNCEVFLDECFALCMRYENLFSSTKEGSDIWNINHANGEAVTVDPATYDLVEKALYYADLSQGIFDPTIGTVTELWNFHADSDKTVPDEESLKKALSHVDYKKVELRKDSGECSVRLLDSAARLDLGGIAKGYIADRLKELYLEKGANSGIINLGGNVLLVGKKPGSDSTSSFNVAIQKPFGDDGEAMLTLPLTDKSLVTSGIYDRYFEKDGRIYHHILDTKTGLPIENNIYSATIVSDSSVDGDALSTICFSLGIEKGMELIESIPDIHVLYITDDYEIVSSAGFPKSTF